jgi:hypothetical protein
VLQALSLLSVLILKTTRASAADRPFPRESPDDKDMNDNHNKTVDTIVGDTDTKLWSMRLIAAALGQHCYQCLLPSCSPIRFQFTCSCTLIIAVIFKDSNLASFLYRRDIKVLFNMDHSHFKELVHSGVACL